MYSVKAIRNNSELSSEQKLDRIAVLMSVGAKDIIEFSESQADNINEGNTGIQEKRYSTSDQIAADFHPTADSPLKDDVNSLYYANKGKYTSGEIIKPGMKNYDETKADYIKRGILDENYPDQPFNIVKFQAKITGTAVNDQNEIKVRGMFLYKSGNENITKMFRKASRALGKSPKVYEGKGKKRIAKKLNKEGKTITKPAPEKKK
ncbi:MAG: hypothetical protein CMP61_08515 [Flavobacteriales bacterium]|nr:hypothetical protein [Flavobacteriales bacterium]|tara:strand:+ start:19332 stop:19949 length:618 start_codon:yes stop_codon:yes gene_type:complete